MPTSSFFLLMMLLLGLPASIAPWIGNMTIFIIVIRYLVVILLTAIAIQIFLSQVDVNMGTFGAEAIIVPAFFALIISSISLLICVAKFWRGNDS